MEIDCRAYLFIKAIKKRMIIYPCQCKDFFSFDLNCNIKKRIKGLYNIESKCIKYYT